MLDDANVLARVGAIRTGAEGIQVWAAAIGIMIPIAAVPIPRTGSSPVTSVLVEPWLTCSLRKWALAKLEGSRSKMGSVIAAVVICGPFSEVISH